MGSRKEDLSARRQNKGVLGGDGTFCVLIVVGSIECTCQNPLNYISPTGNFTACKWKMRKKDILENARELYIRSDDQMWLCGHCYEHVDSKLLH